MLDLVRAEPRAARLFPWPCVRAMFFIGRSCATWQDKTGQMEMSGARRGRKPGFKMPEEHRSKIRIALILRRLQQCALGEIDMTSQQVRSAEILLRKVLPDLSAADLAGMPDNQLKIIINKPGAGE